MSDTTQPMQASWTASLIIGFAAVFVGYRATSWVLETVVLGGSLGEGAPTILDQHIPLGAMAGMLVLESRARGMRQVGLLLIVAVPLVIWMKLAEFVAIAAQQTITSQGSLFIVLPVFAMLALPAFVPAWLKLKRADMLWRPAGKFLPDGSIGPFEAVAIALPGLLAAFLVIDLLRISGWLPNDLGKAFIWTAPYLVLPIIAVTIGARPADPRQWTILGGTVAAVLIAAVLASAGIAFWTEQTFHEPPRPYGGLSPWYLPSFLSAVVVAFAIGMAAREVAHYVAGRHSPWAW